MLPTRAAPGIPAACRCELRGIVVEYTEAALKNVSDT